MKTKKYLRAQLNMNKIFQHPASGKCDTHEVTANAQLQVDQEELCEVLKVCLFI